SSTVPTSNERFRAFDQPFLRVGSGKVLVKVWWRHFIASHSSNLQQPLNMFLHEIEVLFHHVAVPSRARKHDRAFNDPHDVTCQRPCVQTVSRMIPLHGGIQVRFELEGHLVKTLRESPAKRIVRIAESHAEISDNAATLTLLPLAYHLLNGIQPPDQPP